jgi:hypothetical protein
VRSICASAPKITDKPPDTQAVPLRQYAKRRGFDVIEYKDEGVSGSKDRRPALDKLMKDARAPFGFRFGFLGLSGQIKRLHIIDNCGGANPTSV